MLINWENQQLNIEEFKRLIPILKWTKATKKLGSTEQLWIRGDFSSDKKIIKVVIRPTKRAQITETYPDSRLFDGEEPTEQKKSPRVDWGCSVQVLLSDKMIEEIKEIAVVKEKKKKCK